MNLGRSLWAVGIFVIGILGTGSIAPAQLITIDFEAAPGPDGILGTADDIPLSEKTQLSTQFSALGVTFSLVQGGTPFIATKGDPGVAFSGPGGDAPTVSGVNTLTDGIAGDPGVPFEADIAADFIRPVTEVSLYLIDFRADCESGPQITATLKAFDANRNLVDSDSFTANLSELPDGNIRFFQVRGAGIVRVELAGTTQDCGTAIDDLSFRLELDSDNDNVPDNNDQCPNSDVSPTVVIDGCNSGVPNTMFPTGCSISDLIAECAEGARNHGQYVSCVAHVTNDLKNAGIITGQQKGAIQSCAAQADIP